MQCPKCKNEIENNSLKCSFCNSKVGSLCKNCNTYNIENILTKTELNKLLTLKEQ